MKTRRHFKWREGRQGTGYTKMLVFETLSPLPLDVYLLRMCQGVEIPTHTDKVSSGRHFRLNIILCAPQRGGDFVCRDAIIDTPRIKLFRPDASPHSVTRIEAGTRIVLSVGWIAR